MRFEPLEAVLQSFYVSYETALTDDHIIRVAVGKLREGNPYIDEYVNFLLQVDADMSARYLVGALASQEFLYPSSVLKKKGASIAATHPLVGALRDQIQSSHAMDILESYGACRETVQPLLAAIISAAWKPDDEKQQYAAVNAREVLLSYGNRALGFINRPRPGHPDYEALTSLIGSIRSIATTARTGIEAAANR